MTYNVFGGMLSLPQSVNQSSRLHCFLSMDQLLFNYYHIYYLHVYCVHS